MFFNGISEVLNHKITFFLLKNFLRAFLRTLIYQNAVKVDAGILGIHIIFVYYRPIFSLFLVNM